VNLVIPLELVGPIPEDPNIMAVRTLLHAGYTLVGKGHAGCRRFRIAVHNGLSMQTAVFKSNILRDDGRLLLSTDQVVIDRLKLPGSLQKLLGERRGFCAGMRKPDSKEDPDGAGSDQRHLQSRAPPGSLAALSLRLPRLCLCRLPGPSYSPDTEIH